MSRLLIVRGLPGSGKSTYVRNNYTGLFTLETDQFNCVNGKYIWSLERSKEAINLIEKIRNMLIASENTPDFAILGVFARIKSFVPHIVYALDHNYEVYIKTLTTQYKTIHNVPEETMKMFKDHFVSEYDLKEMVNSIYDYRIRSKIHFDDMPKINWEFNGTPDSNFDNNKE